MRCLFLKKKKNQIIIIIIIKYLKGGEISIRRSVVVNEFKWHDK